MSEVTVYLSIEHPDHFGSASLYVRTLDTPFCPRKGDRIVLYSYEGDPHDGPMGVVHQVYWAADGNVILNLERFVVDPDEQMEQIMNSLNLSVHLHGWYTERDGDLVESLLAGGWTTA